MHPSSQMLVSEAKPALRARLERSEGLLLCLDFDGTLAPIADSPTTPTITSANERALQTLRAQPQVRLAIISGRELSDLVSRVAIPGIAYAGNHGLELADGHGVTVHPVAERQAPSIQRAATILETRTAPIPGATVENKGLSLTLHYRQVPPDRVPHVERAVESLMHAPLEQSGDGATGQFRIVPGKQSIEIRPAVDWDKGKAVTELQRRVPDDWLTAYVGDDTTDEDAFEVLGPGDLDVFVGTDETTATYRIPDQREVASFLRWIGRVHGTRVTGTRSRTSRIRR